MALQEVEAQFLEALEEAETFLKEAHQLGTLHSERERDLTEQLNDALEYSGGLRERVACLRKENKALRMRTSRFEDRKARAVESATQAAIAEAHLSKPSTLKLKEKGIIPEPIRALARDLVELGLKLSQVQEVIAAVAQTMGGSVVGKLSPRSVGRFVREGGVAAAMQIVEDIRAARSKHFLYGSTGLLKTYFEHY